MRKTLLLAGLGLALAAAACATPQQPSTTPAGGGSSSAIKEGGRLTMNVRNDPIDYDPTFNGKSSPGDGALALAYDNLLSFKSGPDVGYAEMIVQPNLAERWDVSPDGKTFTFHLRKGVKWANQPPLNGRELNAQDVKWTFEYFNRFGEFKGMPPASHVGLMFEGMESVEAPDDYTVVVKFKNPFLPFLGYAASQWNAILPHEIYDKEGSFKDTILGSGPFQLDLAQSQKGTRWVWTRNRDYWDNSSVHLDEIRWLDISEDATLRAAFQTKQIDLFESGWAYRGLQELKAVAPQAQYIPTLQPQGYHLHLSQAHEGPLKDVRVRRALALSVDRDEINKVVAGGLGQWALPGAMPGLFTEEEARQLEKQDVAQAKKLLAEAGYAGGVTLDWPIEDGLSTDNLTWFQLVQAQVKRAGIDIKLSPMDKDLQRQKRRKGDFDIDVVQALGLLEADPDSTMFGIYHSKGSTNWPQIRDPELDKLLEAQRREVDPEKRKQIQRDAVKRIIDQAWGVELIYPPITYAAQPYVKDYYPHFSVRGPYVTAWLDK